MSVLVCTQYVVITLE